MEGQRKLSVLHARIRNNCSDLKCDLFQNHLTDDKRCICGNDNENALHFFFECEIYSNLRVIVFRQTRKYHPLSLNIQSCWESLLYLTMTIFFFFRQYSNTSKIPGGSNNSTDRTGDDYCNPIMHFGLSWAGN